MTWLRRAYPLVVAALWIAVLAIFLNALRIPHLPPFVGLLVTMALPVMAILALRSVAMRSSHALAVLSGLRLEPLALGFGSVTGAAVLSTIAVLLLAVSRRVWSA